VVLLSVKKISFLEIEVAKRMDRLKNTPRGIIYKTFFGALLLMLTAVFSGCSTNYGRLRLSTEVDNTFKDAVVLPDHKYYYSGSDVRPRAILALHNSYTLRTRLWKEVDLDSRQLRKWIMFMNDQFPEYATRTYGSRVIDPEGKQVGIWYSAWNRTPVKMLGENEVAVYPPMTGAAELSHPYLEPGWRTFK
jgi:hypothetical protein